MNIIGFIPARKDEINTRLLLGKPLVFYTINTAKKSKFIDMVVVSTEDEDLAKISKECGAEVPFLRPKELAQKGVPVVKVVKDFIKKVELDPNDIIVILQPINPLRRVEDTDNAISKLLSKPVDSVMTVGETKLKLIEPFDNRVRMLYKETTLREEMKPLYFENGAVVTTRVKNILETGSLYGTNHGVLLNPLNNNGLFTDKNIGFIIMDEESSLAIHTDFDFKLAELLLKDRMRNGN